MQNLIQVTVLLHSAAAVLNQSSLLLINVFEKKFWLENRVLNRCNERVETLYNLLDIV